MLPRSRRRLLYEYAAKGLFLALSATFALSARTFQEAAVVAGVGFFMIVFALLANSRQAVHEKKTKRSQGGPFLARLAARLVLAGIEKPATAQFAILLALLAGAIVFQWPFRLLVAASTVGVLAGTALFFLLGFRQRWARLVLGVMLMAAIAGTAKLAIDHSLAIAAGPPAVRATALVIAMFFFYVFLFVGRAEETELELGILCAGLALAIGQFQLPLPMRGFVVLIPLGLFVVYCERIRKNLIVFKHVLRGIGFEQQGNLREALVAYRAALDTVPKSDLASAGYWRVHRAINLADLADDREVLELVDPRVCLERAQALLSRSDLSDAKSVDDAAKLLDIVAFRRPDLHYTILRERFRVARVSGKLDEAAAIARGLVRCRPLNLTVLADHEAESLFQLWILALKDPGLAAGTLQTVERGEDLFSLLAVLERRRRQWSADPDANAFQPFVYARLSFDVFQQYVDANPDDALDWFDFNYCWQMARSAAQSEVEADRRAAIGKLRIVELGLPEQSLLIWGELADVYASLGSANADDWRGRIREFALAVGPRNLADRQREVYFDAVRELGRSARSAGNASAAIDNYWLYADSPKSGVETLRILRELHDAQGDPIGAIRAVESALAFSLDKAAREDWLAEKSRLYSHVTPADVRGRLRDVESFFDFDYCYRRAKALFERDDADDEVRHYLELASLGGEALLPGVNTLLGRAHFRAGRHGEAAQCFEAVRARRPARFAGAAQEEEFFTCCKLLGDIYLNHVPDPPKAIECLLAYKDYIKSGADTLYKLGCAYEANGQFAHARKWYDMVLVYPAHPRAAAAKEAMNRLKNA